MDEVNYHYKRWVEIKQELMYNTQMKGEKKLYKIIKIKINAHGATGVAVPIMGRDKYPVDAR